MPGSLVAGPPIRHQTGLKRLSTQYLLLGRLLSAMAWMQQSFRYVSCLLTVWCLSERKKAAVEEKACVWSEDDHGGCGGGGSISLVLTVLAYEAHVGLHSEISKRKQQTEHQNIR